MATVERVSTTLPKSLQSISTAGFPKPDIYLDGLDPVDIPRIAANTSCRVTSRSPKIRTYGNMVLALWEMYIRNPDADRYGMFQDDVVLYRNTREYLDKIEYPIDGYLNLFTHWHYSSKQTEDGWFKPSPQQGLGALALVFDNEGLRHLLAHPHMVDRPRNPERGWRAIDGGIVSTMNKCGRFEYCHKPSIAQHIGHTSTIGNRCKPSPCFLGETYNALDLLPRS